MVWVTADEILLQAGVKLPASQPDVDWASACAGAVDAGLNLRLEGWEPFDPLNAELHWVAVGAGVESYKRREAVFGVTGYSDLQGVAIRVARDYLDAYAPIIARYTVPGIG
jgi:hypothetical protein